MSTLLNTRSTRFLLCLFLICPSVASLALDLNSNQQSDVWEQQQGALGLAAAADADGDGFTNAQEALAATNPRSAASRPGMKIDLATGNMRLWWDSVAGKQYQLLKAPALTGATWATAGTLTGTGGVVEFLDPLAGLSRSFYKISILDLDSDIDGLSDYEEITLGFNPNSAHTDRQNTADLARVTAGWTAVSTITAAALDTEVYSRWPDKGVIVLRRAGGMLALTANVTLSGTAARGVDFQSPVTTTVKFPVGAAQVFVDINPLPGGGGTGTKTVTLTLGTGTGYTVGTTPAATVNIINEAANALPNPKAAARFLVQAAFGPDQDAADDADDTPENVEQVMALGYSAWLEAEFAKPATHLQPFATFATSTNLVGYTQDRKQGAWWNRAMGVTTEIPGGAAGQPTVQYDMLRQRVAFSLSQLLVVSDRPEALLATPEGMANYYDLLIDQSFGNYRDLLYAVTRHPVMGYYLSALKNKKADVAKQIFPDENYAREVMQLFTIGLWQLNQDGSRKKDALGKDIPTYDNTTITNFARVFTGMSFAGSTSFSFPPNNWLEPMKLYDAYHDLAAKTLLNGQVLPARTASNPDVGTATNLDLNAAVDNLFNHANVPPFVAKHMIQRLVTSNPSPGYISRVAAAFINNGSGARGDMKAVIRAVLLDTEARDPANMSVASFGRVRDPFLRVVNFARAFNASSPAGFYQMGSFFQDHYQEPLRSPSVFNFFSPGYGAPGEIEAAGLVSPELQILHATSAVSSPNYYYNAIFNGLHRNGQSDATRKVTLNLTQELPLTTNPDALLRRLDLALTYGNLSPKQFELIRAAILRIPTTASNYQMERVRVAIYMIVTSPEFAVLR